jgi:hypothetical protein
MHVHVDEAGHHDEATRHVDDSCAVYRQIAPDPRDAVAVDQHVEDSVTAVGGIDDATAFQ